MSGARRALAPAGFALAVAIALAGCGIKSKPVPPEDAKPERITRLLASPDPDGIRLAWPRPDSYTSGQTMRDLAGFVVMRAQGEAAMAPVAELPVSDRERFQKIKGLEWVDITAVMGSTYRYQVVSTTSDGYRSDPSNQVSFTRIVPPPPANPANFALPAPSPLPY